MEEDKKDVVVEDTKEPEMEMDDSGLYVEKGLVPPKLRSPNGRFGDYEKQQKAWENYVKSWREGRPNIKQAGIDAGFCETTAQNMGSFKWFRDRKNKLRRSVMLTKAEKNLSKILDLDYSKIRILPDGSQVDGVDVDTLRIVADVSKTVATTLGKDLGYSTKTEVGGKVESEIKINSISYADKPVEIEAQVVVDEIQNQQNNILEEVINKEE